MAAPPSGTDDFRLLIVAGMPRSATTFLHHSLSSHPQLCSSTRKEVNFFCLKYSKGKEWYRAQFDGYQPGQWALDVSPNYFFEPSFSERVLSLGYPAKIILGVRDPVEYVLSLHTQRTSFAPNTPPFEKFLEGAELESGKNLPTLNAEFKEGAITNRIEQLRSSFGSNLLLFDYRFFSTNQQQVLESIETFAGVSPFFEQGEWQDRRLNASSRNNSFFLSYLLSREWFTQLVERTVPRKLLTTLHRTYQRSTAGKATATDKIHSAEHFALAEAALKDQQSYVAKLFKDKPIQLGNEDVLN